MEKLKALCLAFCAVCVLFGGAEFLLPNNNFNKILKYALGVCAVFTVLCAVKGTKVSLDISLPQTTKVAQNNGMQNGQAEYLVATVLQSNGIAYKKVVCITDITAGDNILIIKATVYSPEQESKITQALQPLNIKEVNVVYEE